MLDSPVSAIAADLPHSFMSTPAAFRPDREAVVDAMVRVMRVNARQGQATSADDFAEAKIPARDVDANFAAAKAIIDAEVIRQDAIDVPDEAPALDPWVADADYRTKRVDKAATLILGKTDPQTIFALLRAGDAFTSREIGDLWPRILDAAAAKLAALPAPMGAGKAVGA